MNKGTMKALVYHGPRKMVCEEVPLPVRKKGEALVRMDAVGICGSDMHAWHGKDERRKPPLILGHEPSGIVLKGKLTGKHVAVNPLVTCGSCVFCVDGRSNLCAKRQIISMAPRPGAFAEFLSIPERNLIEIPSSLLSYQAALAEPFACGRHAVCLAERLLGHPLEGANVMVVGGGAIGVGIALFLGIVGVDETSVVESNLERRRLLTRIGDFSVCNPDRYLKKMMGKCDAVFDAHGSKATQEISTKIVRRGGVVVNVGLANSVVCGYNTRRMTLEEIVVAGSYTYTQKEFQETVDDIKSRRYGNLNWVEQRSLEDGPRAFKDISQGLVATPKIVLCSGNGGGALRKKRKEK